MPQWVSGGFSRPGKMPGLAWGIPAKHCRVGSELAKVDGTACNACYARKGTYAFDSAQKKLDERYRALFDPRWVPAMVAGLRVNLEPGEKFRFFDSGDLQSESNLRNILRVCSAVRDVLFWAPTREHSLLRLVTPDELPENLIIRLSGNQIDGKPPKGWPWTSTVVSGYDEATCPTSQEGGSCDDEECDACWDRDVKTVKYLRCCTIRAGEPGKLSQMERSGVAMSLILPREDEIRSLAYALYRKRCDELGYEEHGFNVQDWTMAERAVTFHKNFERVTLHQFVTKDKQYLGAKDPRVCRFCGKDATATTFKKISHAVPQLLGNRSIIAHYECDKCNKYFSEDLEDHLGKLLGAVRTLLRIRGSSGIPSFKTKAKTSRMDVKNDVLQVPETVGDRFTQINPDENQTIFKTETQKFIPLAAHKCFTKVALSLMPEGELAHYGGTMKWVMNPDHKRDADVFRHLSCYRQMTPGPFPDAFGFVELLKRRHPALDLPYMVLVVATQNLTFQIYPPLCDLDAHINGKQIRIPRFPAGVGRGYRYGETTFVQMNLSSADEVTVEITTDMRAESMTNVT